MDSLVWFIIGTLVGMGVTVFGIFFTAIYELIKAAERIEKN